MFQPPKLPKTEELIFGKHPSRKRSITPAERHRLISKVKKCEICGRTEKQAGKFHIAHKKRFAKYRSDKEIFLLCPICHTKYDDQKLTKTQVRKLGMTWEQYIRYTIRKKPKKKEGIDLFKIPKLPKI